MQLTVVQNTEVEGEPPYVLVKFKNAVGGFGYLHPGSRTKQKMLWEYRVSRYSDVQAVLSALWPYLGPVKRAQAIRCFAWYHAAARSERQRAFSQRYTTFKDATEALTKKKVQATQGSGAVPDPEVS